MDKANLERNIAYCDGKIAECDLAIVHAKAAGKNVDDLVKRKEGYEERRAQFVDEGE